MRKRHAREIRKGILLARTERRARQVNDFAVLVDNLWKIGKLEGLSLRAFNLTYRRGWKRK